MKMFPPSPQLALPTASVIFPDFPCDALPVYILTLPLSPRLEVPVYKYSDPLDPVAPEFADRKMTFPDCTVSPDPLEK